MGVLSIEDSPRRDRGGVEASVEKPPQQPPPPDEPLRRERHHLVVGEHAKRGVGGYVPCGVVSVVLSGVGFVIVSVNWLGDVPVQKV